MDTKQKPSIALVDVTSALQLRVSAVSEDGVPLDIGVALNRINAQHLADALLEYSGARVKSYSRGHKTTIIGTYHGADFKETRIVILTDADKRRGAARSRLRSLLGGR